MVFVFGGFLVFFLVFFVVCLYHGFFWDFDGCLASGVRCWVSCFECGFVSQRFSENYFSCSFFLLLVFFVVFDLEVSLLLNIPYEGFLYKNLFSYFVFLLCLVWGYLYEVECGFILWDV